MTRTTKETDISVTLNLDGSGNVSVSTNVGFFDHMLTSFATHAGFDLEVVAKGDLFVDSHHTVEDVGIVLGNVLNKILGDKGGISRFGTAFIPMDEALSFCSIDISARPFLVFDCDFKNEKLGEMDSCLAEEFFRAFAFAAGLTLHIKNMYGTNDHHKCESLFKSAAYALKIAVSKTSSDAVISTKGML